MIKSVILLIVLICLSGCDKVENFYNGEFKNVVASKELNVSDINIQKDVLELLAPFDIIVVDTFLIVNNEDPENFLQFYNTNTLDYIGGFIKKGRGPGEDQSIFFTGKYTGGPNSRVGIQSRMNSVSYDLDIPGSVEKGSPVILNINPNLDYGAPWVTVNDNLAYGFLWTMENSRFTSFEPKTRNILNEKELYKKNLQGDQAHVSGGWTVFKPDLSAAVKFNAFLNQVDFVDIDEDRYYSLSLAETPIDYRKVLREENYRLWHVYYDGGGVSDQYAIGIYINGPDSETLKPTAGCELHLFTWTGELYAIIRCPQIYCSVAHDVKNNRLFLQTRHETIDIMDISGLN